ncbi:MAG: hypothetical protein ABSB32_23300 [Thermodesulfobacteriota bacterium]|jgi:hypothetical protein
MEKTKLAAVCLVIVSLLSLPVVANAHWGGGGVFLGFGAGLLTGILLAPSPAYVAPPVYVAPPPAYYPSYPPAPIPAAPPVSGYSENANAAVPPPSTHSICREWRPIDRHLEDRWDSYSGRWQQVGVERWGWVEVPCNN